MARFSTYTVGSHFVVLPKGLVWEEKPFPVRNYVDEFVNLIIPDDATAMAGLRGKELDFFQVAQQNLDSLKKTNPEIQLVEWEYLYIPFIYWHVDQPPFTDPRPISPRAREGRGSRNT